MLHGGLEISRPLIVVWVVPALAMLLALAFTPRAYTPTRVRMVSLVRIVLLGYLTAAIVLTLWPLDVDVSVTRIEEGNWTPFEGTLGFLVSENRLRAFLGGRDVLANVVLFTPFGLLLPFASYQWHGIALALAALVVLAFGLELAQGVMIAERTFDIDDPIAGCVGAVLGVVAAAVLRPVVRPWTSAVRA